MSLVQEMLRRASGVHRNAPGRRRYDVILAVVIDCSRRSPDGWTTITCSRLLGNHYEYDPDPPDIDKFIAWGGIDPPIRVDHIVTLHHIEPLPNDPEVEWFAQFTMPLPPGTADKPRTKCLTMFPQPCSEDTPTSFCIG